MASCTEQHSECIFFPVNAYQLADLVNKPKYIRTT